MITIQELLFNRDLDATAKIKLVRHKDGQRDLYNLYRYQRAEFLDYQNSQSKDVFNGVDFIVSFIGEEGVFARFIGVFKIMGSKKLEEKSFLYDMEEVFDFEDLKERVIINWGAAALAWHQWIGNQKEVIQIHPGLHYKQFTDYSDFILDFMELKEIVTNQYADWKKMLSVTKGIYLISDAKSGKLYVGSAYGDDGIWGRWAVYASTNGHGNNKLLKELLNAEPQSTRNFRFSILMILPKTITADQAIEKEKLFKRKLGKNACGLNAN